MKTTYLGSHDGDGSWAGLWALLQGGLLGLALQAVRSLSKQA